MELPWDGPAVQPPSGITPIFDNPPNQNVMTYAIMSFCLGIVTVLLTIRVYSKSFNLREFHLEDALAIAGFGTFLGYFYCSFWRIGFVGTFVHTWNIRLRDLPSLLYYINVATTLYAATMLVMKPAIVLEWVRIFVPGRTRNLFWWTAQFIIFVTVGFYASAIIATNLSCIPHRAIWDLTIEGKCINARAIEVAGAFINVAVDLLILALPQRVIWSLNMSKKRKIGVSLIFAVGLFACVSAGFRLAASLNWNSTGSKDPMYSASSTSLWGIAEMTCTFLVFSMPSLPKAFSDKGWASRLASSFRSWTFLSSKERSQDKQGATWPLDRLSPPNGSRTYRIIDENSTGLESLPAHSSVPITTNSAKKDGINYTKQFITTEERDDGTTREAQHRVQHPWTE